MRFLFTLALFPIMISSLVFGQERFGELAVSQPEEMTSIVRNETMAVLTIISEVPELQFDNTRQIFETEQISENEWRLYVDPGRQTLTVRASGYLPLKTAVMFLQAKRVYRLMVTQVKPIPGSLFIATTPDSASLRINGVQIDDKTPYLDDEVTPGEYHVEIAMELYQPIEKTLIVEAQKVAEWVVELKQTAVRLRVGITNDVQDVGILVNEEPVGIAPGVIYLEPDVYVLKLQKKGYQDIEIVIEVGLGQEEMEIQETMEIRKTPLLKRWWFLTTLSAAIGSGTYFLLTSSGKAPQLPTPPEYPSNF